MNEVIALVAALISGLALGGVFFGGLWWTLQRLSTARQPHLLMLASTVIRMAIAVLGFYACVKVSIQTLLACLAGFLIARVLLTQKLRNTPDTKDPSHAP